MAVMFDGNHVNRLALTSGDVFQIGGAIFRFIERDVEKGSDQLLQTLEILFSTTEAEDFLVE